MTANPLDPDFSTPSPLDLARADGDLDDRADQVWPELTPQALHGIVGDLVIDLEPNTEADPAALLVMLLVAAGNSIGAGPHVRVGGAAHPARLNAVIVGETSRARKGQAWADVRQLLAEADPRWCDERIMSGLGSGEGLIATVSDPDDDDPQSSNDRRLLVMEPEYARVLAVAGREGSTLSAIIREAWDTGNLRVITRSNPLVATGANVSVLGHITIDELRRSLTATDAANGYANRFLYVLARRSKLLPSGPALDDEVTRRLGRALGDAIRQGRSIQRVQRTPGAEELWALMYHRIADTDPGGLVGAITARAEAQLLRLSLAYALLDGARLIDTPHLEAAAAVWRYCERSAAYIFGNTLGDAVADQLYASICAAGPAGLTSTQQSDVFGRNVSADRLNNARRKLLDHDLVFERTEPTAGRPRQILVATKEGKQTHEVP